MFQPTKEKTSLAFCQNSFEKDFCNYYHELVNYKWTSLFVYFYFSFQIFLEVTGPTFCILQEQNCYTCMTTLLCSAGDDPWSVLCERTDASVVGHLDPGHSGTHSGRLPLPLLFHSTQTGGTLQPGTNLLVVHYTPLTNSFFLITYHISHGNGGY